jgi:hypothetical protein
MVCVPAHRNQQGPEVMVSRSNVAKTLKKDLGAIEKRLARFRMDAVLPGTDIECMRRYMHMVPCGE